jgi:hypothetical protein
VGNLAKDEKRRQPQSEYAFPRDLMFVDLKIPGIIIYMFPSQYQIVFCVYLPFSMAHTFFHSFEILPGVLYS